MAGTMGRIEIPISEEPRKLERCPRCNYDMRAHLPGARCPECGLVCPSVYFCRRWKSSVLESAGYLSLIAAYPIGAMFLMLGLREVSAARAGLYYAFGASMIVGNSSLLRGWLKNRRSFVLVSPTGIVCCEQDGNLREVLWHAVGRVESHRLGRNLVLYGMDGRPAIEIVPQFIRTQAELTELVALAERLAAESHGTTAATIAIADGGTDD